MPCRAASSYWTTSGTTGIFWTSWYLVGYFLWASTQFYLKEEPHFLQLLNTPEVKSDEDILAALFSALIMLLLQWYYRGFDTPTEEMAKKFLRLLHSPLVKLPEELA